MEINFICGAVKNIRTVDMKKKQDQGIILRIGYETVNYKNEIRYVEQEICCWNESVKNTALRVSIGDIVMANGYYQSRIASNNQVYESFTCRELSILTPKTDRRMAMEEYEKELATLQQKQEAIQWKINQAQARQELADPTADLEQKLANAQSIDDVWSQDEMNEIFGNDEAQGWTLEEEPPLWEIDQDQMTGDQLLAEQDKQNWDYQSEINAIIEDNEMPKEKE